MGWLTQNWIWVALAIGVGFYFLRIGQRGQGGLPGPMDHAAHVGHMGHGGHGAHGGQTENRALPSPAIAPAAAIDPVGGEAVNTDKALTSVYQGMIYFFASRENRDRFEGSPQEYASKGAGHALHPTEAANERPRRRHGC